MLTSLFSTKKKNEPSEKGISTSSTISTREYNDVGKFGRNKTVMEDEIIDEPKQEKIKITDMIKARLNDKTDILDISKLGLQEIPLLEINCISVTTLISCKNPIVKFDGLQQFTYIKELNISGCGVDNLFDTGVLKLLYLRSLDLSRNSIASIPDEITSLSALEVLILQRNKIQKLPVTMNNLKYLRKLDLSYNNITGLLDELEGMPRLEEVNLSANPNLVVEELGPDILRLFVQVWCQYRPAFI